MTAYYVMILLLLLSTALYAALAHSAGGETAVEWRSFRGRVGTSAARVGVGERAGEGGNSCPARLPVRCANDENYLYYCLLCVAGKSRLAAMHN